MNVRIASCSAALALLLAAAPAHAEEEMNKVGAVGLVAAGLGGLALISGGGLALGSLCQGPRCGHVETTRDMAIGFSIVGVVLLAVGVPMILFGRSEVPPAQKTAGPLVIRF
jgi:hypothetical protein